MTHRTQSDGPSDIPGDVRRFIATHIDSISLLDTLLLLRADPDRPWSVAEAARALVSTDSVAAANLDRLASDGLVEAGRSGYRFAAGESSAAVDALADCYKKRRHAVIGLVYGEGGRQATTLADAFRLRRGQ